MIAALFIALGVLTLLFVVRWILEARAATDTPEPLYYVMGLVTCVIIYTGISLLTTAAREPSAAPTPAP